jgi:hypothetical protein
MKQKHRPSASKHAKGQADLSSGSLKAVKAWAWAIQDTKGDYVFCFWAEPDKERLERRKPSAEAKAVPVWISLRDRIFDLRNPNSPSPRMKNTKAIKRKKK